MIDKIYSLTSDIDATIADIRTIQHIIASNVDHIPSSPYMESIELMSRVLLSSANKMATMTEAVFNELTELGGTGN